MNQERRVTAERQGHVLLIGLDRVAKRNAFDRAILNSPRDRPASPATCARVLRQRHW